MAKTPYQKGQKARRKGRSQKNNPFSLSNAETTSDREWWDKGWRDEDSIILALSPESGWKTGGTRVQ